LCRNKGGIKEIKEPLFGANIIVFLGENGKPEITEKR